MTDEQKKQASLLARWIGVVDDNFDPWNSEEASALLLEKMPEPELWVESAKGEPKLWSCTPDIMQEPPDKNPNYVLVIHADRKTCIALAALKLIDMSEEPKR